MSELVQHAQQYTLADMFRRAFRIHADRTATGRR
jgi:hypothetical protein